MALFTSQTTYSVVVRTKRMWNQYKGMRMIRHVIYWDTSYSSCVWAPLNKTGSNRRVTVSLLIHLFYSWFIWDNIFSMPSFSTLKLWRIVNEVNTFMSYKEMMLILFIQWHKLNKDQGNMSIAFVTRLDTACAFISKAKM